MPNGHCSIDFFQTNIAKRCQYKNRSTAALLMILLWICSGFILFVYYSYYPQTILVAVAVLVLTTEGFFSVALGIFRWGRNLGDVIYEEALKFVEKEYKSDQLLQEKLLKEISFYKEALQNQYNAFYPFRNLVHESSDGQIFRSMCEALSSTCFRSTSSQ